jgi:hypothetical protein
VLQQHFPLNRLAVGLPFDNDADEVFGFPEHRSLVHANAGAPLSFKSRDQFIPLEKVLSLTPLRICHTFGRCTLHSKV